VSTPAVGTTKEVCNRIKQHGGKVVPANAGESESMDNVIQEKS
jgi:hypothetical protein